MEDVAALREKSVGRSRSGGHFWSVAAGVCLHTIATSIYIKSNLIKSLSEILSCFHLCKSSHLRFT